MSAAEYYNNEQPEQGSYYRQQQQQQQHQPQQQQQQQQYQPRPQPQQYQSNEEDRPVTHRYAYNPEAGPAGYNHPPAQSPYNPERPYSAHQVPPYGSPVSAGGYPHQPPHSLQPVPQYSGYNQPPPPQSASQYSEHNQPHYPAGQPPYPSQAVDEEDRGFTGALAGGAAGAYGGHKLNHGLIGTVGGAYAGSKLQDHFKHEQERKEEERRRLEEEERRRREEEERARYNQHHQHQDQHRPVLAGNFSASATGISLDGDHDLIASCRGIDGQQRLSSISLNSVLTNSNGELRWAKGGNFGASARHVRLVDDGRVLEAELGNGRGGWNRSVIRLDERITNQNGNLVFLE